MDDLLIALENGGARIFSQLVNRNPNLGKAISNGLIRIVSAPVDAALERFLATNGKSYTEFASSQLGRDIIANHFSYTDFVIPANLPVPGSQIVEVSGMKVVFIDSVYVDEEQLSQWRQIRSEGLKSAFGGGALGNTGLSVLIKRGEIKGQDLLNLCLTNFEVNDFCNSRNAEGRTMFHDLLQRDFQLEAPPGADSRKLYDKYTKHPVAYVYHESANGQPASWIRLSTPAHSQILHDSNHNIFVILTEDGRVGISLTRPPIRNEDMRFYDNLNHPNMKVTRIGWYSKKKLAVVGENGSIQIFDIVRGHALLDIDLSLELRGSNSIFRDLGQEGVLYIKNARELIYSNSNKPRPYPVALYGDEKLIMGPTSFLVHADECSIRDVKYKELIQLGNFEGGSFRCDAEHVQYFTGVYPPGKRRKRRVAILNDEGILWMMYISENQEDPAVQTPVVVDARIIDFEIVDANNAGAQMANVKPPRIFFLLEDGRLGTFTIDDPDVIAFSERPIPGLAKVPRHMRYDSVKGVSIRDGTILEFDRFKLPN